MAVAASNGREACLNLLIKAGADVNAARGVTPLMNAFHSGHPKCVLSLIEAGADVNSTTKDGNTALIIVSGSSMNFNIKCVELLLRLGAKVNLFNNKKQNALCSQFQSCVLDYLDKREINLKELCRETIRKKFRNLVFLAQYLLCDISLDT